MTDSSDPIAELVALLRDQRAWLLEALSPDGPERAAQAWQRALDALPDLEARLRGRLAACTDDDERCRAIAALTEVRQRARAAGLLVLALSRLGQAELAVQAAAGAGAITEPPTYPFAGRAAPIQTTAPLLLCEDA